MMFNELLLVSMAVSSAYNAKNTLGIQRIEVEQPGAD